MDVKQRVFEAAGELLVESGGVPTVAMVRERARCSNADATRFLREWRGQHEQQVAQEADVPAVPANVEQVAQRSTRALWQAAVQAARAEHTVALAAAQAGVETARAEAD